MSIQVKADPASSFSNTFHPPSSHQRPATESCMAVGRKLAVQSPFLVLVFIILYMRSDQGQTLLSESAHSHPTLTWVKHACFVLHYKLDLHYISPGCKFWH